MHPLRWLKYFIVPLLSCFASLDPCLAQESIDPLAAKEIPKFQGFSSVDWGNHYDYGNRYVYYVSPSGKLLAAVQQGYDSMAGSLNRVFLIDPDHPAERQQMGGIFLRGLSVLFSPDGQWIVLNNAAFHGSSRPYLFRRVQGLRYEEPLGVDVNQSIRHLYAENTGDVAGSKSDGIYVTAFDWKPDSSGFHVSVDTRYHDLKVQPWSAFYDTLHAKADSPVTRDDRTMPAEYSQGLDNQLAAMYKLVSCTLSPEANQKLNHAEESWLKERASLCQEKSNQRTRARIQQLFEMLPGNK